MKFINITKPNNLKTSPQVTLIFDNIRNKLSDDFCTDELYWFMREYSRCYRHYVDCAEYRLNNIYSLYLLHYKDYHESYRGDYSVGNYDVMKIYWEFEAFLNSLNSALDILARLIGLAYKEQTPPSFNKLIKKREGLLIDELKRANALWVHRMKSYRDCFTHYTPVDTLLMINFKTDVDNTVKLRCKLPDNPNARDILGFTYKKKYDVYNYSNSVFRHFLALDRSISNRIVEMYKQKLFPMKSENLFFLGSKK